MKQVAADLRLIDSHCHVHDSEFFDETQREAAYQRATQEGIGMICVGTDVRSSREAVAFAADHQLAWAIVGVHPHEAKHGTEGIEALLSDPSARQTIVGIGEVGLDYFYQHSSRQAQIAALEAQLQLAQKYQLPLNFHVRAAFDDFWPVFDNFSGLRGVLHSFTDSPAELDRGLSRSLYIGVNGISTFTKDPSQQKLYQTLPLERMLLETDAPFLTPAPFRGKVNEPVYVKHVAAFHAHQRGLECDQVGQSTLHNTRQLLSI